MISHKVKSLEDQGNFANSQVLYKHYFGGGHGRRANGQKLTHQRPNSRKVGAGSPVGLESSQVSLENSRLENDWPSGSICLLHRFCSAQVSSCWRLAWRAER